MILKESPSITASFGLGQKSRETIQKIAPILVIPEYLSPLDSPDHDVMQNTMRV
jgi:hypothetical protein